MLTWLVTLPIKVYQYFISPFLPAQCRFYPSCSTYSLEAVQQHGALRGGVLGARRLLKCHPWHKGGWDPVPESIGKATYKRKRISPCQ